MSTVFPQDSADLSQGEARPQVLVVDDRPARGLNLEAILADASVGCVRAGSTADALEQLLKQEFAVLLLDAGRPGLDPLQVTRLIREHPRSAKTPVLIVVGAHVPDADLRKIYELGLVDHLPAPVVPEILKSKISLLIELSERRAAERYRAVFEHPVELMAMFEAVRSDDGSVLDWRYLDVNSNALKLLGMRREAVIGRLLSDILPARAVSLTELWARVLASGVPHPYEATAGDRVFWMCVFPIGTHTIVSSAIDITPRIEATREAQRVSHQDRAEKEWLAAVLNSMNEEVYFTDTQRHYTYANPAALREFGHVSLAGADLRQIVGRLEVLRPDGSQRPMEEAPPLRSLSGEVIRGEEQIVRIPRTGELRHRQVSSAPVRNAEGGIIGAVSVVRDFTDQKRVNDELQRRDARSRALVRLADEFRVLTAPRDLAFAAARVLGETLKASRCGYGTIDAAAETVSIERDWSAPGIPSIAGVLPFREYGTYIENLKRGEIVVVEDAEADPRTASNAAALIAISARSFVNTPIVEQGGLVAHIYLSHHTAREWSPDEIGFIREVAERTRIAVERRRSEQAVANDLKDTRLLRDLAARLVRDDNIATVFEEILDAAMKITEAEGGTIQLLDPETSCLTFVAKRGMAPELACQFERVDAGSGSPCGIALATGQRAIVDFDVPASQDPDGSCREHLRFGWRCAQSTPLVSRAGVPLGMFSTHWRTLHPMSERELRFLDLLGRQAADLVERVRAQEKLRASEQELRDADRRKDEFIAVLAHELRNPLVPIRTGTELLKSAREKPELLDAVRPMMERQLAHMVRLIDDLLDVSRITSGKMELQKRRVTLSSLIMSAVEANRSALASGNLDLSVNQADPSRILNVDPTRFSQVISNLLQNATKFTPKGGRIAIDATIESGDLVIKVADNGIGISGALMPRVFELFAQAHPSGEGIHAGLGIGLALARRLTELHGGTLTGRSEGVGKGSEFTVRVPAPAGIDPSGASPDERRDTLQGVCIAVIDDNRDGADAMGMLITNMGCEARVYYDGASALNALEGFTPDIVLLDIGMPDMDGYEVCRRIRGRRGTTVSIVAVTGWGQEQDRRRAAQAGFDAHLTKPADPAQIADLVAQLRRRAPR